jgi:hypothetical protein
MTADHPRQEEGHSRLTPFWALARKVRALDSTLQMKPSEDAKSEQADANQIDRDHEIEQPRHEQNKDAGDQGNNGRNMRSRDGHRKMSPD